MTPKDPAFPGTPRPFFNQVPIIALRLYQSGNLTEILKTTVDEIRQLLHVDRAIVYRFQDNNRNRIVAESVGADWMPVEGTVIDDPCFQKDWLQPDMDGRVRAIEDIDRCNLSPCYIEFLQRLQVKATVVVPIFLHHTQVFQAAALAANQPASVINPNQIWGLLIVHQCSRPHVWNPLEIAFLQQLALHVAIAIQKDKQQQFSMRLLEIFAAMTDLMLVVDRNGRYLQVLSGAPNLQSIPTVGRVGKSQRDFFSQVMTDLFLGYIHQALDTQTTLNVEYKLEMESGEFWSNASISPIDDHSVLWVVRDITQRKQAEAELRSQQMFLRKVIDVVPSSIFVKDLQERYLCVNQAEAASYGLTVEELLGKRTSELNINAEMGKDFDATNQTVMTTLQTQIIPAQAITDLQGKTRWYHTIISPFIDSEGQVQGIIGSATNVTDLKRTEEELRQAKETAEMASRTKSTFLATMSHEIRTPMNAVIGMTELLMSTNLTAEQQELVEVINNSGAMLLTLINDILDFSKIESGKLDLESQPFSLQRCVQESLDLLTFQATEKRLTLDSYIASHVPAVIIGDVTRLRQILINLLSNAVKFTDIGKVSITVDAHRVEGQTCSHQPLNALCYEIQFAIQDTGIGISPERLNQLFQPFTQADASITRRYGGTGLGLTISRHLSEMMGGKIWVESQPGKGSTFYVTIVVAASQVAPAPPYLALISSGTTGISYLPYSPVVEQLPLRILVVDDIAINQKLMLKMLRHLNYQADVVNNGMKAVEALQKQPYDLVLMDIQMPELDGIEATRRIRRFGLEVEPWIVAITAHATQADREECLQAGMNDYLTKPVSIDLLMKALNHYSASQQRFSPSSTPLDNFRSIAVIDAQIIQDLKQLGGEDMDSLLTELIGNYLEDAPLILGRIQSAIINNDRVNLKMQAHSMRSMSLSLGATRVSELCKHLELMPERNTLREKTGLFSMLELEYEHAKAALQQIDRIGQSRGKFG